MGKPIDRIKQRLTALGKAKTSASLEAGLSASFIRTLEIDPKKSMTAANAVKLSKVLETTPEWILFGVPNTRSQDHKDNHRLDPKCLDLAMLKTDQVLVGYKIKLSREDRIKMIAYHYEEEMRKRNDLQSVAKIDAGNRTSINNNQKL